jgi:hypothetical protein
MAFTVTGANPSRSEKIYEAIQGEWYVDELWGFGEESGTLQLSGDSRLCGGESEEEFADRLSVLIWQANQGFCEVEIIATYLENMPYEKHTRSQEFYDKVLAEHPDSLKDVVPDAEPVTSDAEPVKLELLPGFEEALKTTSRTEALYQLVEEKGLDLDEYVHQLKSMEASDINNEGSRAQFSYMIEVGGVAWVEDTLGNYK